MRAKRLDLARQRARDAVLGQRLDRQREVQALVRDVGERVALIHGLRREHGVHLPLVELAELLPLGERERVVLDDANPPLGEPGQHVLAQAAHLLREERHQPRAYLPQLFELRHPVGRELLHLARERLLQARDADHEELVQILGEDGEELQPFEQRLRRVERLFEHAPVELDLAELAVEERQRLGLRLPGPRVGPVGALAV
jgi:hypothetical protein